VPRPDGWAKQPSGKVFDAIVQIGFTDADGKRWFRNSDGKIQIGEKAERRLMRSKRP